MLHQTLLTCSLVDHAVHVWIAHLGPATMSTNVHHVGWPRWPYPAAAKPHRRQTLEPLRTTPPGDRRRNADPPLPTLSCAPGGFQVLQAANAAEGLALAATQSPDLVILDLGLPNREGHEVLAELRQWATVRC